jgi:hypothetical protein
MVKSKFNQSANQKQARVGTKKAAGNNGRGFVEVGNNGL